MNKSILETSPEVAPLLVRLHDKHKLYSLAKNADPMARAELTSVMVDLLGIELSARESELITDVLVGLMRQAEKELRLALAERLADMDNVPLRMVLHLANDEIMIADPILRKSPVLHDMDLIYIIKSQGPEHWQSIASRASMSDGVIDVLADTRHIPTAITLAENDNIRLTEHAIDIFETLAQKSEELAQPLLQREELPSATVAKLYRYVGEELKIFIKDHYDLPDHMLDDEVEDLVVEFENAGSFKFAPTEKMIAAARNRMSHNMLRISDIMGGLKRGQIANFIAQFATYSALPVETVQDILKQENGQGLAVACKALGIQKPDFVTIFLQTHKIRSSKQRIINQYELATAIRYYDKIKVDDAQRIMNQSRN